MVICPEALAESLIFAYYAVQICLAIMLLLRQWLYPQKKLAPGLEGVVRRGPVSMATFNGWFAGITGFNLGIGAIVVPLLPHNTARFGWILIVLATVAWFYIIYWTGWFRNWYLGVLQKTTEDR